jgi:hypothetical protein
LFGLYDKGYSLIDIYHFMYEYIKVTNHPKKYIIIEKLCSYIQYIYDGFDNKIMLMFFTNDIYNIHIAVKWAKTDKNYINDIKQIPINKFINVKNDKKEYYDNNVEDDIYDTMIKLIDNKLNKKNSNKEFKRMTAGNNLIINGSRKILLN